MQQLLSDPLRRAEKLFSMREAIIDGSVRLTYRELGSRCRRLAGALRELGVESGDRVATLMANGHRYLECYFGVPGMGAVLVPLNNRHAIAEHRYICEDAGVRVLIVDEAHAEIGAELAGSAKEVLTVPAGYESALEAAREEPLGVGITETDVAGLFYTGGTTGAAKGVMLTHRNLIANALHVTIALHYTHRDKYLHAAPMFHIADAGSTYAVTWAGGAHVFVPAFEPKAVMDCIGHESVTATVMVPTMLSAIVNHPDVGSADLTSLRMVTHGGAPIAAELLKASMAAMGCSFTQAYGMTEAAPVLTALEEEEHLVDDPRLRSAGTEVTGVEVEIRRADGTLCEPEEVGEVVARGPNLMVGYWNRREETDAVLRDGWYWSGDLGYSDDEGYIFIVDRAKDMIISGGENVYGVEVEDALMSHPSVLEAAVIGIPHDTWGEAVHAIVVLRPTTQASAADLITHCRERIAGYKCPKTVDFAPELPKSGAGKILKRQLREPFWAGRERQI